MWENRQKGDNNMVSLLYSNKNPGRLIDTYQGTGVVANPLIGNIAERRPGTKERVVCSAPVGLYRKPIRGLDGKLIRVDECESNVLIIVYAKDGYHCYPGCPDPSSKDW